MKNEYEQKLDPNWYAKNMCVFPENPRVVMFYHDDWTVNVLLSDGRVYSFFTEMWLEHGFGEADDRNWRLVLRRATLLSLDYAERGIETWAVDSVPETIEDFHKGMDALCMATNDADFRRYMRS